MVGWRRRTTLRALTASGLALAETACGGAQQTGRPVVGTVVARPAATPAGTPAVVQPGPLPRTLLANPAALALGRDAAGARPSATAAAAMSALRQAADKAMNQKPVSVMDKKLGGPSGDEHDYQSLSPYWWPDPQRPDGRLYIQRDGQTNPEVNDATRYDRVAYGKMAGAVETLSLAAYLTGKEDYARHAAQLLRTWFLDDATRMTPHWKYAQLIPGREAERGTGIIDGRRLINLGEDAGMLTATSSWTAEDHQGLQRWYADLARWLRESSQGQAESQAPNNHGTWYDAQLAYLLLFSGDTDGCKQVLSERSLPRIGAEIQPDGRQPQELRRTLSYHYSAFNLMAFCILATLGERVRVDLWRHTTRDGRSIRLAIDYLAKYLPGGQPWPQMDIKPVNYFQEMGSILNAAGRMYSDGPYQQQLASLANTQPALAQLTVRLGIWDTSD